MKIDIRKTYDTVNWSFLTELLKAYKFPSFFVNWITTCVHSVSYSLLLNGEPTETFRGNGSLH